MVFRADENTKHVLGKKFHNTKINRCCRGESFNRVRCVMKYEARINLTDTAPRRMALRESLKNVLITTRTLLPKFLVGVMAKNF